MRSDPKLGKDQPGSKRSGHACGEAAEVRLPPLAFGWSSLEPAISREVLFWHHEVVHRGYVAGLNESLESELAVGRGAIDFEHLFARIAEFSDSVRLFAGGYWNHALYWSLLTDQMENHEVPSRVLKVMESAFGSMDEFKAKFAQMSTTVQGPGWIWLVQTQRGLEIECTEREGNPLMAAGDRRGWPILGCDLWQHAYRLSDRSTANNIREYVRKFLAIVNWSRVEERLDRAPRLKSNSTHLDS